MSLVGRLLGGGIKEAADGIGSAAESLRFAFTGDVPPETQVALTELDGKVAEMQSKINLVEAGKSFFHSGWRPALAWICTVGIMYDALLRLVAEGLTNATFPAADDRLWILVTSLLGLGALRTVEKFKGVQNKH